MSKEITLEIENEMFERIERFSVQKKPAFYKTFIITAIEDCLKKREARTRRAERERGEC